MEDTAKDPVAEVERLTKEVNKLKWATYRNLAGKLLTATLKAYLYVGVAMVVGSLLLKPIWVACKWLWNLY